MCAVLSGQGLHTLVTQVSLKGSAHCGRVLPRDPSVAAWLAQPLARLPQNTAEKVHELRLRTGCGICLSIAGQQTTLDELPECPQTLRGRTLDALQMDEILYVLCGGSVHTHQAELAQGYLTTASGCVWGWAVGSYCAARRMLCCSVFCR